jgi:hypothetical protein
MIQFYSYFPVKLGITVWKRNLVFPDRIVYRGNWMINSRLLKGKSRGCSDHATHFSPMRARPKGASNKPQHASGKTVILMNAGPRQPSVKPLTVLDNRRGITLGNLGELPWFPA